MMDHDLDPDDRAEAEAPTPSRRPRQQLSSMQIVFAAILSIGLLLVINLSGRIARGQQMDAERARLQATIDVLETQQLALRKERDYAESDAKVEQWAHSEGKMVREGEVLVIPIPGREPEITPTPTPPVSLARSGSSESQQPPWRLWWQLFFEGDPPF